LSNFVPLLAPIVTAIVGALGLVLKERRHSHDRHAIRENALADAKAQVAMASEWLKVNELLGPNTAADSTKLAREWIADAEAKVTSTQGLSDH
jgi:hypothetical protein